MMKSIALALACATLSSAYDGDVSMKSCPQEIPFPLPAKISYHFALHCDHYLLPRFHIQATFYGQGGAGQGGACMLERGFNGVGITVAINQAQWDGAGSCGKCIKVREKTIE